MKLVALFFRFVRSSIVPLIALLLCAAPAAAQVVFDSASNAATATASVANPVAVSWNHTVGLSKKPYLVVEVSLKLNGGGATVSGVAYGTEAGGPSSGGPAANTTMVFLGAATNPTVTRAELWGIAGPVPGTHQITVTVANGGGQNIVVAAGAKSFFNVFQTAANGAAVGATGNSVTPSVTLANSPLDYVVDAVAYNANQALAAGANQTNAFNLTNAAPAFSGAGSIKTGFANTTMSWTAGVAAQWATVAVNLQSANPQISFDAASTSPALQSNANPITVTWNHTTTNAANRYLVVGIAIHLAGGTAGTNVTVNAPTYGAQTMTFIGRQTRTTNVDVELWGLVAPASGTNTISFTVANTGARALSVVAGGQSFSNVDQNTPLGALIGNNGNSTTPTVAVANSAYDYVVDVVGYNTNQALTTGANQDSRWATVTGGTAFSGAGSGARGYTNVTMSWTAGGGGTNWAIEAIPLKQVTVGLKKTASADVIKLGTTVTYTLVATNYTNATVTNVTITDNVPAGATFVSQTGCGGTGPVTCNIGSLGPGASSAPITVTVVPNVAGSISNVATVSYTGSPTANSSETVSTLAEQKICASPGKDGAGGTLAGIKNDYWPGSATVASGVTSITVGNRAAGGAGTTITTGDLIIIMQMQDAAFDTTNDETYGEGTGSTRATGTGSGAATTLNNAGRWEYAVVASTVPAGGVAAAGGTININGGGVGGGSLYGYTAQTFAATTTEGQRTYQVIRVPQYTTATLGSTLTALAWNGATGGILAIDVSGTLTLGGATVSVDGLGFRGGAGRVLTGDANTPTLLNTDFATLATRTSNGSKGEGIAGTPRYIYQSGATIGAPGVNAPLDTGVEGYVNGSYGRGGPGNGGGGSTDGDPATAPAGGNDMNSGGGGGGNGGNGGSGGNGWSCNCPGGGQGGGSISPSLTRITMGGGGGAGTTNNGSAADATGTVLADSGGPNAANATGYYSSGADGGGVMIIRALQATGTATLTANGLNGPNTGRDGPGGGGAGGSVLMTTQVGTLTGLTIQARGGKGGSAWTLQAPGGPAPPSGERHGPGGGGGGGYILLSSAAASTDVSGGVNGVTTTALDPYGAQPGTAGIVQTITGNNVLPGGDGASCAVADLAVTDSSPSAPVGWLNNITFTQTVVNNGTSAADSVIYRQAIPASSTFQSIAVPAGWTCITPAVGGTGDVTCTRPTLAPSDGVQNFSLVVQTIAGTPSGYLIVDTNSVSSLTPDSNPANNVGTASTPDVSGAQSDMAVTLTNNANTITTAGSNVTFTSVATNIGFAAATSATWSIPIPPNMSYQSIGVPAGWTCITPAVNATSGSISCTANSTIASNASSTFTPVFKVVAGTPAGTSITGTATTGASNDPNLTNNTANSTFTVNGAAGYDMVATLSAVGSASTPGIGTIATTNASPNVTGTGTSFTKQIKKGDVINIPGQGYFRVASVTDDTHLVLTANASATAGGLSYSDVNTAATPGAEVLAPAGTLTFTSIVSNNGPAGAPAAGAGVQWVMVVPANTTFQSIGTIPPGWVCATPAVGGTGTITCTLQTAGVNQPFPTTLTSVFSPVFAVNPSTASGTTITGTATVNINGVTTGDNVPSNNTASDSVLVTSASNADVAIVKSVSPNPIGTGQITNYTLAVTNNGPLTATNVTISDTLPASLTFISSSISSSVGACAGTTTVTCTINTLPVNNTATITLVLQATSTGTIPNTASITGATQTDPVAANNSSTANLTVLAVTLVRLRTFTATQSGNDVQIAWATSFESDNLGFNVYRDTNGLRAKVNKNLIAGTGLISKKKDLVSDHTYRLNDKLDSTSASVQYWLEDVDIRGVHTLHGPVAPLGGSIDRPANTVPLPGLGSEGSVIDSPAGYGIVRTKGPDAPTAKENKQQADLAGATALKIYVTKEGWYHLTRAQMTAAGYDPGSNGRSISLYNLGVEQPVVLNDGGDGSFDPNDYIEFYANGIDTISTGANTYWLRSGSGSGNRIPVSNVRGADPVTGSVPFTYSREERSVFIAALTNGDDDNYFGPLVYNDPPATQDLIVGNLDTSYAGNATLALTVQGATDLQPHAVDVALGSHDLGVVSLVNQEQKTFTFTFPQSWLVKGTNTLTFRAMDGDNDVDLIALTQLTYQHLLRADNGALEVNLPGGRIVTVGGFTQNGARALDVTDVLNPVELQTTVATDPNGGFAATFTTPGTGSHIVLVFDPSRVSAPPELSANTPSNWASKQNSYDFLIITNSAFTTAATTLKPVRAAAGLATAVVDVEDTYDEFNFGIRSPEAIRSFLQNAATKWKKAPRYVLLVGDASIDPRNYLELGAFDFVPTKLVNTTLIKTASDDWFTDFNGDGIADIPIGRIPVRTADEASLVFNKLTSRGTPSGAWANSVLFVSDRTTDFDFGGVATGLAKLVPATMTTQRVDYNTSPSPGNDTINALNNGQLVADYIGHASVEIWSDNVFGSSNAASLSNGNRLPFVVAMDCLNGYFHDLYTTSLAEAFLKAPNGGAVAVWASSTLTQPDQQAIMNGELLRQLFAAPHVAIGDAIIRAKTAASDPDVRKSWILFGDPSMPLR
jgi:uncharacterized repeat protein (TIGR01451 family)